VQNYRPSFKSPLYPWVQIVGIITLVLLILDMGTMTVSLSVGIVIAGVLIYLISGRLKDGKESALLHLIERITSKELTHHNLESELSEILHERDAVLLDRFDEVVQEAEVIDCPDSIDIAVFFEAAAEVFASSLELSPREVSTLLEKREQEGSTAISHFVAVPHLIINGNGKFKLLIARCTGGIRFNQENNAIKAVFVLAGTRDERNFHLKALSAIAQIVQDEYFEKRWLAARNPQSLKDVLLLSRRKRFSK
ncbi:MAG: PTS sugar transporter subunit IIA, partial [Spirochaetota bacterium]